MAEVLQSWKTKLSHYASVRTREDDASDTQSSSTAINEKEESKLSRIKAFGRDTWALEIFSAIASVLSFVGIVAVVGLYDGRRTTLLPHGITLNAIVSILATLTKATLSSAIAAAIGQCKWLQYANGRPDKLQSLQVIDDASRGPRGSIMLLLNRGMRPLAIFGAVLTIVSIGLDPSLQLLIHTDVRPVFVNDTGASLMQVMTFKDTDYYKDGLSLAYRDSVISALSDDASNFDMTPICPSKNCTWPEYRNLRFSSECTSVTQWMYDKSGSTSTSLNFCQTTCPNVPEDECGPMEQQETICSYPMPQPFGNFSDEYDSMGNTQISNPVVLSTSYPGYELLDTETATLLNQSWGQLPLVVTAALLNPSTEPDAYLCAISFHLDTLNTSVEDGVASTRVLDSMPLSDIIWLQETNGSQKAIFHFVPDERTTERDVRSSATNISTPYFLFELLNMTLPTYFNGTLTEDTSESHVQYSFSPAAGDEILVGMAKTSDFTAMMDRAAASMSKRMREVGGTILTGQSGSMETYFRIRWAWIVLPTLVMLGGIAFLAIAAFQTRRQKTQVWKSSALPLMYCAQDCDLKRDSDPVTLSQMESLAKGTLVRLQRSSSTGLGFQRTTGGGNRETLV